MGSEGRDSKNRASKTPQPQTVSLFSSKMSFVIRRQLSTLIPPKIASAKVCCRSKETLLLIPNSGPSLNSYCLPKKFLRSTQSLQNEITDALTRIKSPLVKCNMFRLLFGLEQTALSLSESETRHTNSVNHQSTPRLHNLIERLTNFRTLGPTPTPREWLRLCPSTRSCQLAQRLLPRSQPLHGASTRLPTLTVTTHPASLCSTSPLV